MVIGEFSSALCAIVKDLSSLVKVGQIPAHLNGPPLGVVCCLAAAIAWSRLNVVLLPETAHDLSFASHAALVNSRVWLMIIETPSALLTQK